MFLFSPHALIVWLCLTNSIRSILLRTSACRTPHFVCYVSRFQDSQRNYCSHSTRKRSQRMRSTPGVCFPCNDRACLRWRTSSNTRLCTRDTPTLPPLLRISNRDCSLWCPWIKKDPKRVRLCSGDSHAWDRRRGGLGWGRWWWKRGRRLAIVALV